MAENTDKLAGVISSVNLMPGDLTREDWDRALDQVYGIPGTVFKVGDRVRLTGSSWPSSDRGRTITVNDVDVDGQATFYLDGLKYGIYIFCGDDFSATLVEQ